MAQVPPHVREGVARIRNKQGLHLRPATVLAETAQRFGSEISVAFNGETADAKSILSLVSLVALCGAEISIRAEGPDADAAVVDLVELVHSGLGADPGDLA